MYWSPAPLLQDTSTDPQPEHVQTCSTWTSVHSYPPGMFKLVHCEVWTVNKYEVGIQLRCLLAFSLISQLFGPA